MKKIHLATIAVMLIAATGCTIGNTQTTTTDTSDSETTTQTTSPQTNESNSATPTESSSTQENNQVESTPAQEEQPTQQQGPGKYIEYSDNSIQDANTENVVLFFRAKWCPTCKVLHANIEENKNNIPSNLTIIDVDFDTYSSLKSKYGILYQHTLVQVDKNGEIINKWSGSPTLADIVKNLK